MVYDGMFMLIITETMVTTERTESSTTAPGQIITIKATDLGRRITTGRVTTVIGGRDGPTRDTARDMRRDMTTLTGTGRDETTGLTETTGESLTEGKITTK